jgi:hypothetical protein
LDISCTDPEQREKIPMTKTQSQQENPNATHPNAKKAYAIDLIAGHQSVSILREQKRRGSESETNYQKMVAKMQRTHY